MDGIKYDLVSVAVVLRDYTTPNYVNKEHKMLVDIADTLWNAGLGTEDLKPEYRRLHDKYSAKWWELVFKDIGAIESQINYVNKQDLMNDYATMLFEATDGDVYREE